jgi:predicted RNA-binding protein with PIN domain
MPFLIDGYNLLRAVEKIPQETEAITDVQLCRIICAYLRQVDESGQIVFDGVGPPDKTPFENFAKLEVIFSGRSQDADGVIECKILASTAPKRLTVVSSDRQLRAAARKRKAVSLKVEQFWRQVLQALSRQKKDSVEPRGKREGISDAETEQWLKTFGLKDQ